MPVVVAIARSSRARAAWMRELAEAHVARVQELHLSLQEQAKRLDASRAQDRARPRPDKSI